MPKLSKIIFYASHLRTEWNMQYEILMKYCKNYADNKKVVQWVLLQFCAGELIITTEFYTDHMKTEWSISDVCYTGFEAKIIMRTDVRG